MTVHRLNPEVTAESARWRAGDVQIGLEEHSIAQAIVKARALQSFGDVTTRYPIHRLVRCAVRGNLGEVFDDLALSTGLTPQRLHTGMLLLDGCPSCGAEDCYLRSLDASIASAEHLRS
jgi:hypothetical protein